MPFSSAPQSRIYRCLYPTICTYISSGSLKGTDTPLLQWADVALEATNPISPKIRTMKGAALREPKTALRGLHRQLLRECAIRNITVAYQPEVAGTRSSAVTAEEVCNQLQAPRAHIPPGILLALVRCTHSRVGRRFVGKDSGPARPSPSIPALSEWRVIRRERHPILPRRLWASLGPLSGKPVSRPERIRTPRCAVGKPFPTDSEVSPLDATRTVTSGCQRSTIAHQKYGTFSASRAGSSVDTLSTCSITAKQHAVILTMTGTAVVRLPTIRVHGLESR